jgi:hypothetical protein
MTFNLGTVVPDENDESVIDYQSASSDSSLDDLFFGDLDLDEKK